MGCKRKTEKKMLRIARNLPNIRRWFTSIDKEKMTSLISNPKVFVFDVRDQNEVDGGHIDAANINHIPLDEIDEALMLSKSNYELIYELKKPDQADQIVVYCMAGIRAANAAEQFEGAGFSNVSVYPGGWKEWNASWNREDWEQWSRGTGFPLDAKFLDSL